MQEKAVVVFSGGIDSVCSATHLSSQYEIYGITFSYGQRAGQEVKRARRLARALKMKEHRIVKMPFMREIYAGTNVLTDETRRVPEEFEYSIVVPIRNVVFLSIAAAWAYTVDAPLVAYGAHTGDANYPDCRPAFARSMQRAINQGESDGIRSGARRRIRIWSPYVEGLSKSSLIRIGYERLGDAIFETWSCYLDKRVHCGACESCRNRRRAFADADVMDRTEYANIPSS